MPKYPLERLESAEFERLSQTLAKAAIGVGTITFGAGRDGGREATFQGSAPYPSQTDNWHGDWVVQAKFHDTAALGMKAARAKVMTEVAEELDNLVNTHRVPCDNYILVTNVSLSSVRNAGNHDTIRDQLAPAVAAKIRNVHVWGADEICRFLDLFPAIRQSYLHLLTPGDVLATLMRCAVRDLRPIEETIKLWLVSEYQRDRFAQLDQAGDVSEDSLPLQRVFIDVDVQVWPQGSSQVRIAGSNSVAKFRRGESFRAMPFVLSERYTRTVFIGGPGQGKTTLGQMTAQIHRAALTNRLNEAIEGDVGLVPLRPRLPFRVVLREFAQWATDQQSSSSDKRPTVEEFLAQSISRAAASGADVSVGDLHDLFKANPILAIFDGLDEVVDARLRSAVMRSVEEFIDRCETALGADLMVVASSRPNGYEGEFDTKTFLHLELDKLTEERASEYVRKWIEARALDAAREDRVRTIFSESSSDNNVALLITTPLQVNIILYVILSGGRPSRQRESLFTDYVDVIYRRERAKHRSLLTTERDIIIGLHEYLGYILHVRSGTGRSANSAMSADEFESAVSDYLRSQNPFKKSEELSIETKTLVDEARLRLVLLVENVPGSFGFELRSLQEYFAGSHLVRTAENSEQRFRRFVAIATSNHWRNAALFFAGRVGRSFSGEAPAVVEACRVVDRSGPDVHLRRGAVLARDLAGDRVFGSNEVLQRSLIEHSATLLDAKLEDSELGAMESGSFGDLGQEELRQHLLPVLATRVPTLSAARQRAAVSLVASLGLSPESLSNCIIERTFDAPQVDGVAALLIAMRAKVDPNLVRPRFAALVPGLERNDLQRLGATAFDDPFYFLDCVGNCSFNDADLGSLLRGASSGSTRVWQRRQADPGELRQKLGGLKSMGWKHAFAAVLVRIGIFEMWALDAWDVLFEEQQVGQGSEFERLSDDLRQVDPGSQPELARQNTLWTALFDLVFARGTIGPHALLDVWRSADPVSIVANSIGVSEIARESSPWGPFLRRLISKDFTGASRLAELILRLESAGGHAAHWTEGLAELTVLHDNADQVSRAERAYGFSDNEDAEVMSRARELFPEAPAEAAREAARGAFGGRPQDVDPAVLAKVISAVTRGFAATTHTETAVVRSVTLDLLRARRVNDPDVTSATRALVEELVRHREGGTDLHLSAALLVANVVAQDAGSTGSFASVFEIVGQGTAPRPSGTGDSYGWYAWREGIAPSAIPPLLELLNDVRTADSVTRGIANCLLLLLGDAHRGWIRAREDSVRLRSADVMPLLQSEDEAVKAAGIGLLSLVRGDDLLSVLTPITTLPTRLGLNNGDRLSSALLLARAPVEAKGCRRLCEEITAALSDDLFPRTFRLGLIHLLRDAAQGLLPMEGEEETDLGLPLAPGVGLS